MILRNNKFYTEYKENRTAIVSLLMLLFIGFGTFLQVSENRVLQIAVAAVTCAGYLLWGVFYHYNKGDLTMRIVLEYFMFSFFFLTLTTFLVLARV